MSITEKTFSDGFIDDIVDLIKLCIANNTDNVQLSKEIDGVVISVDMAFSIKDGHKE